MSSPKADKQNARYKNNPADARQALSVKAFRPPTTVPSTRAPEELYSKVRLLFRRFLALDEGRAHGYYSFLNNQFPEIPIGLSKGFRAPVKTSSSRYKPSFRRIFISMEMLLSPFCQYSNRPQFSLVRYWKPVNPHMVILPLDSSSIDPEKISGWSGIEMTWRQVPVKSQSASCLEQEIKIRTNKKSRYFMGMVLND